MIPSDVLSGIRKIKKKGKTWLQRRDGVWQRYTVLTAPKKGYIRRTNVATKLVKVPEDEFRKGEDVIFYSDGGKVMKVYRKGGL